MAEVTSGENLTVIVLREEEVEGLAYVLSCIDSAIIPLLEDEIPLYEWAVDISRELIDALGVEVD